MLRSDRPSSVVLAIDTAFGTTVALGLADRIVVRSMDRATRGDPLHLIDTLLRATNMPLAAVTHIAVRTGIGSYTGLRIGVTLANLLAWSLDRPVVGLIDQHTRPLTETELNLQLAKIAAKPGRGFGKPAIPKYAQWSRPT